MGATTAYARFFGPPEFSVGGQQVSLPLKAAALVAYLACSGKKGCSREYAASLLWPDAGSASARHSLSQALYVIRKGLGSEVVSSDLHSLRLGQIRTDVWDFADFVGRSQWKSAAVLYRGLFGEGLRVPGGIDLDHFLDAQRARLLHTAQRVASELALLEAWPEARQIADVILEYDPENTTALRAKAQALVSIHGRQAALGLAEALPASAAKEVHEIISSRRSSRSNTTHGQRTFFVGRDHAMGWLEERYNESVSGDSVLALVKGEAGIGKTALATRFSRLMALRGSRILMARAYPAEQNVPFGVVSQWIQSLSKEEVAALVDQPWVHLAAQFFPDLGAKIGTQLKPSRGEIGHHRLMESLRRVLVSICRHQSVVIVLDDLHAADPASRSFLHYLLRLSGEDEFFFVATARSGRETARNPVELWDGVTTYSLRGFNDEEVALFIEASSGSGAAGSYQLEQLARKTGGNPFLLSILCQQGELGGDSTTGPPATIVDFLRPRLSQRSPEACRILSALAIVGEPCAARELAEIGDMDLTRSSQALGELQEEELVTVSHGEYTLRHGLVGEVALSLLTPPGQQRLYGRTARVLAKQGTRPSPLVAVSHDLAGNQNEAFDASMEASRACDILHAHSEKEFFLKLALSNAPSGESEARVRVELAEHHLKQGRLSDALKILDLERFSNAPKPIRQRGRVIRLRAMAEMTSDVDVFRDLWVEARSMSHDLPALAVADIYTGIAGVAYDLGLDLVASEVCELVVNRLSELSTSRKTALRMLRPTGINGFLRGYSQALEVFASLPVPGDDDPVYSAVFNASKATLLVAAGRLLEAEELFAHSLGIVERYALFDHIHSINNNLGVCLLEQGRYVDAEERLKEAFRHAPETNPSRHSTSQDNLMILAYEKGAHEEALRQGLAVLEGRQISGMRAAMSLRAIVGLSALAVGDLAHCREAERELQVLIQNYGQYSNDMSYVHIFLARMLNLRNEHQAAVEALVTAGQYYRSRNLLAGVRIDVERCRLEIAAGSDCTSTLDSISEDLEGTGAVPLIDAVEALETRLAMRRS